MFLWNSAFRSGSVPHSQPIFTQQPLRTQFSFSRHHLKGRQYNYSRQQQLRNWSSSHINLQTKQKSHHYKTHSTSRPPKSGSESRGFRWLSRRFVRRLNPLKSISKSSPRHKSIVSRLLSSSLVNSGFVGPLFSVFARLKFFRPQDLRHTSMSLNKYVREQNAHNFDQNEYPTSDRSQGHDDYDDFNDRASIQSSKSAFTSFRSKAEGLFSQLATKHASASISRQISRVMAAGTVASGAPLSASNTLGLSASSGPPPKYVEPSENEELSIYPSYCRQVNDPEYESENNHSDSQLPVNADDSFPIPYYEFDIRGCVTLPPPQNRRTKLALTAARRIAGVSAPRATSSSANFDFYETNHLEKSNSFNSTSSPSQSVDNLFADIQNIQNDTSEFDNEAIPAQSKPITPSFTTQPADVLDARMRPFLCRPIMARSIDVEVFSKDGKSMLFKDVTETATTGRFNIRIKIPFLATRAIITAGLKHTEINVDYIPPVGVSVISDIDDTIKITGILGGKRDLFRNVFVNNYTKIEVQGIRDCYAALAEEGATFHYVSNSPWQLYPTVSDYVRSAGFPKGSMHLKTYPNLANGIFEPAAEKKRRNLHQILRDFPRRKFLLYGDSGEGDLEAYLDAATTFPDQVVAVMIRDITLPENDRSMDGINSMGRNGKLTDKELADLNNSETSNSEIFDGYNASNSPQSAKSMFTTNANYGAPSNQSNAPPLPPRSRNSSTVSGTSSPVSKAPSYVPPPPIPRSTEKPPIIDLSDNKSSNKSSEISKENVSSNESKTPKQVPKIPPKPASLRQNKPFKPPQIPPKPQYLSQTKPQASPTADKLPTNNQPPTPQSPVPPPPPASRGSTSSLSGLEDVPPPLPKRPDTNLIINSKSRGIIDSSTFLPPPPLPRNHRSPTYPTSSQSGRSNTQSSSSLNMNSSISDNSSINGFSAPRRNGSPVVLSSSQDEFYEGLDKQIDVWKDRVHTVRARLPPSTVLRLWRVGSDVQQESKEILQREKQAVHS